jgi:hypothetical protein
MNHDFYAGSSRPGQAEEPSVRTLIRVLTTIRLSKDEG